MKLGTAIIIIFAVQAFLWPAAVWAAILGRLAVVAAIIAASWFVWIKPQSDADNVAFWTKNIARLTPICEQQKLSPTHAQDVEQRVIFDACGSLQGNKDALAGK